MDPLFPEIPSRQDAQPPAFGPQRSFRAPGIREAFTQVKAVLGPDAVILETRDLGADEPDAERRFEIIAALPSGHPDSLVVDAAPEAPDADRPRPAVAGMQGPATRQGERPVTQQLVALEAAIKALQAQVESVLVENREVHTQVNRLSGVKIAAHTASPASDRAAPLVAAGVDRDVAECIVNRAVGRSAPRRGLAVVRPPDLAAEIERSIHAAIPLWDLPSGAVCALVGPTGAGKTATLLKIAGLARFAHGRSVVCISTDTQRIGAYEQLAMYGDIMGVPTCAAPDRDRLDAALEQYADVDLVLIDTPGHNPFDDDARSTVLKTVSGREVSHHLVLPATMASASLAEIIPLYGGPALESLIITKVDEARGVGAVLASCVFADVPVSHLTTGQNVPDDIQAVDVARISREILAKAS